MDTYNAFSLTGIAAALAGALNIEPPRCAEKANPFLAEFLANHAPEGHVDRVFMYNPDAIAHWVYQKYTPMFAGVARHTQLGLPLTTVMPSVTPVCFATMYSGAYPETHGIRRYEKPVLKIDTLFDAVLRAGKKCCIVGDMQCSMTHIFRERDMDYFALDTIEEINAKAAELISEDKYDLLCVYNGNYDSTMHKTGPESAPSLEALRQNVQAFDAFTAQIQRQWRSHRTLLGFAMDHGCHEIDGGCGSHGLDMPEDLNIHHFYGIVNGTEEHATK